MMSASIAPSAHEGVAGAPDLADGESVEEERPSRVGGYLAALALAASIVLAFGPSRAAVTAQGGEASTQEATRAASTVVAARTPLFQASPRAKRGSAEAMVVPARNAAQTASEAPAQDLHERTTAASAVTPTLPPPASGTLGRPRRRPVIDTADPWSATH
jgi:hypothetical protein